MTIENKTDLTETGSVKYDTDDYPTSGRPYFTLTLNEVPAFDTKWTCTWKFSDASDKKYELPMFAYIKVLGNTGP